MKEIAGVRSFFRARGDAEPSHLIPLQKSFADTLVVMLNSIKSFGPTEGTQLMESLKDAPYGEVHSRRICDHVDSMMQKGGTPTKPGAHNHAKQVLKHWWNYCTAEDWKMFRNKKASFNMKMTTIVERGLSVGCLDPDEQALKWALATLLLVHYDELPEPQQIYDKLQDLKESYASERQVFLHEQLLSFPDDAMNLPEHIYNAAYTADTPPVAVVVQGINTVADAIPLRKNSKLLKARGAVLASAQEAFTRTKREISPKHELARSPRGSPPDDHDELVLCRGCQDKLHELRVGKSTPVKRELSYAQSDRVDAHAALDIRRAPDGSMSVSSAHAAAPTTPTTPANAAPGYVKAASVKEELRTDGDGEVPPDIDDLDPYTRTAIQSLQSRDVKRKEESTKKRQAKALMARPAACVPPTKSVTRAAKLEGRAPTVAKSTPTSMKTTKKEQSTKEATAKKVKTEPVAVPKSKIIGSMPKMPSDGSNPAPVHYKKGIIYTSRTSRRFRALSTRGDMYSESSRAWGSSKPSKVAWAAAVKSIDERTK